MDIFRDKGVGKVWLSQRAYIQKILQKFGVDGRTKSVRTPLAPHFRLSAKLSPKSNVEKRYISSVPYTSAVGSLIYMLWYA